MLYLGAATILVLGHENCGAVNAVIQNTTKDIEAVATLIKPAVQDAKATMPHNLLETATKINARRMRDYLLKTPVIAKLVKEKRSK